MRCGGPAATSSSAHTRKARCRHMTRCAAPGCRTGPTIRGCGSRCRCCPHRGPAHLSLAAGSDGVTSLRLAGRVELPAPLGATVDVWWLEQYAGGLFLPLRDGTAGTASYGGGRYLLDTAKGADLGGTGGSLVVDLNFLYHPSCRYDSSWQCPLAPGGNTITAPVRAGERL